ncbi:MAG: PEP-CTERM sorting domain-containing protein, partial [Planctomycetaceae bacterium]|nr:PEP-CTERM sorting domain-containing protein [Planctomycetaceae bacterium]
NLELDKPHAATAIDGILHVVGSHNDQAARQLVDLATGAVSEIEFFESHASAAGPGGDTRGIIAQVTPTPLGILYVGETSEQTVGSAPTSWLTPSDPQGGVNSFGLPAGGFYLDVALDGTIVGSIVPAIYATHGSLPEVLPGSYAGAHDISDNAEFIVGSVIWQRGNLDIYQVFETSGFDFTVSGGVPEWEAVELDPVSGLAIFAGTYFNLDTFTEEVGFWNQEGDFLFSAGANSTFMDFEVYDGQLVAATNGLDDGRLIAITDHSLIDLEEVLGEKTLLVDDGLYRGSVGIVGRNAAGQVFVSSFSPVPEPGSLLLLALAGPMLLSRCNRTRSARIFS